MVDHLSDQNILYLSPRFPVSNWLSHAVLVELVKHYYGGFSESDFDETNVYSVDWIKHIAYSSIAVSYSINALEKRKKNLST